MSIIILTGSKESYGKKNMTSIGVARGGTDGVKTVKFLCKLYKLP